jgi:hypothetical protein
MAAFTSIPSIHVFLGRPLFRLSSGIHSIINFGTLRCFLRVELSDARRCFMVSVELFCILT